MSHAAAAQNASGHLDGPKVLETGSQTAVAANSMATDGKSPAYFNGIGNTSLRLGNFDAAITNYRKAIELNPDLAEAHCGLGFALQSQGNLDAAIECHRKALAIKPDFAGAHSNLGLALQSQGNLDAAIESYRRAIQIQPNFADAHFNLALALKQQGNPDEAINSYRLVLSLQPNDAEAYYNMGNALMDQGRMDKAIESYRRALSLKPDYAEAHYNMGNALMDLGRLNEAIESYRRALSLKPDHAEAHYNMGNALMDLGRMDEAIESYRSALSLKPDHAEAYNNMGNALKDQGRLDKAIESYRRALSLKPDYAEAHYNMGNALMDLGRMDEAIECYRSALSLKPDHADAHNNMGNALKDQGRLDEAIESYRSALSVKPDHADAYNNMGNALKDQGRLDEAIESYRSALSLKPDHAEAHYNMGDALMDLGRMDEAIESYRRTLSLQQDFPGAYYNIAGCLSQMNFLQDHAEYRMLLIQAISAGWRRPIDLAAASISLIMSNRDIGACIQRAVEAWPTRLTGLELFGDSGLSSVSGDHLLQCLLENTHTCHLDLERFLTMARHILLVDATSTNPPATLDARVLTFYCALAKQCFINEYVFSCTDEEFNRARLLRDQIADTMKSGGEISPLQLVATATYFPLSSLPSSNLLPDQHWPVAVTALIVQQVNEPMEEQQLRSDIPCLNVIDNDVSRLVQQQYEENPYPRWIKSGYDGMERTIDGTLRDKFPLVPFTPSGKSNAIDILIAGCGTGQHSIETARHFSAARVLAIDLSLSSLCYAKRKTRESGLENIEYAQADIMKLGSINRRFDLIESVGVLHHLADPLAGWRELVSLLRPHGIMRLGFYSEYARRHIVAARAFIAEQGYASNAADIRRCREDMASMHDRIEFRQLTATRDFYSTSECRDLLFHVQEHRLTLPQLKVWMTELGLEFIGFSLERQVIKQYCERFPGDKTRTNLDNWNVFETENPHTFAGMYQFYVQKRR